tara:strand:+ start:446 stop:613 length:168 start_codon:yes stop_codon:yes gene_type:complete
MAVMTPGTRGMMLRDQGVTRVLSAVQITMTMATTPEVALATTVVRVRVTTAALKG